MKRMSKKAIAVLLAIMMIFSCCTMAFALNEEKAPVILIPGFGQSETKVYDDNGGYMGDVSVFDLPNLDIKNIVLSVLFPALSSVTLKHDAGLSAAVKTQMNNIFKPFAKNDDGTYKFNTVVRQYNASYADSPYADRSEMNLNISLNGFSDYDDYRYYFTYDSFGSIKTAAENLHSYLHDVVLAQTGASKVIFLPVSQGGTVFQMYLDMFPEDYQYIKKVISMIPAYDGSPIVGDVLTNNVNIYDINKLHTEILPSLLDDPDLVHEISIALRLTLSSATQKKVLKAAVEQAVDLLIRRSSSMWALCPAEQYKIARDKWLSDDKLSAVREECDSYNTAKENFPSHMRQLMNNGATVHTIVSYDKGLMLGSLFGSNTCDADDLLAPSSPSLGATSAPLGKTLGDDYVSPKTYCSNPAHNHISPDLKIDASTGFLPENTWYFKGVSHTAMNGRNDIKNFAVSLIVDDSITDVYSSSKYSQFNDPTDFIYEPYTSETNTRYYYYDRYGNYLYSDLKPTEPKAENNFLAVIYKGLNNIFGVFSKLF